MMMEEEGAEEDRRREEGSKSQHKDQGTVKEEQTPWR